jgi:succinoglycan biosynthesis transport protein ExoP
MQTLPAPVPPTAPIPERHRPGLSLDEGPRRTRNTGLQRLAATLYRFRWILPIPVALGVGAGFLVARQARPDYQARSTVWIDSDGGSLGMRDGGPLRSPELLRSQAWVELLRSYTVLDPVVRSEKLYLETPTPGSQRVFADFQLAERFRPGEYRLSLENGGRRYRLATAAGATVEVGNAGGAVGQNVGFRWHPDAAALRRAGKVEFNVVTPRDAAVKLGNEVVTHMAENGNFLRLELTGKDPERIASTLNTLTDRYVTVAGDLKRARLQELERILGEQLGYAAGSLAREESSLQGFRVRTITLPADRGSPVTPGLEVTQNPVLSNFFSLNMEREQIQRDRDDLARVLSQSDAASVSTVEAIPSVQKSSALVQALGELTAKRAELRAMSGQFTDLYVPLQKLREQVNTLERTTIPGLAARLDAELAGRQHAIDGLITSAGTQLRGIPPRAIEEARLTRRVEIAEDLYKLLQQRHEEARLSAVTTIPDVRVLDRATVPYSPSRDPRLQWILLFSLAGLGVGVLGAMLYDKANPRLAYPEQVTEGLGLPILGAIPRARVTAGPRPASPPPELPEAFRGLRLGLVHASGVAGPLVVTITSPGSGDGKSFVSANLALTFAEQGHRVLVIDGDLRRGTLHRVLGGERKPGLSDYLAGTATRADVVQRTPYEGVHLIAGGTRAGRGPEMLSSPQMAELVADLRAAYRVILIDSPPIGACVDPLVLATLTRDMLLVLRNGATDRQLAEWNLDLVDRLPIRVLGAVINGISPKGAYRAYRYLKGYDYQVLPEDTSADVPRLQPA